MTTDSLAVIREALVAAKAEVQDLIAQRQQIDIRIAQLSKAVASMSVICHETAPAYTALPLKLTDSCHAVVATSNRALSPKEIRDTLIDRGYELGKYTNALASIHTVLKRLAGSARIQKIEAGGKTLYAPLGTNGRNTQTKPGT